MCHFPENGQPCEIPRKIKDYSWEEKRAEAVSYAGILASLLAKV